MSTIDLPSRQIAPAHSNHCLHVSGILLQDLAEYRTGRISIARFERRFRLLDRLIDWRGAGSGICHLNHTVDELFYLTFRQCPHEPVDRLALEKGVYRGDRLDAHLLGNLRRFVDVKFHETHFTARFRDRLLDNWRQLLAGTAPGRPKIHDDRSLLAGVQDVGSEVYRRSILNCRGADVRAVSSDDLFHDPKPRVV